MNSLVYLRPKTLPEAVALGLPPAQSAEATTTVWLAGGQSLLSAMRLGMATPKTLIDLQDLSSLRDIRLEHDAAWRPVLWIGAMATHASIAADALVRFFAPGLASLAAGIADQQVRNMGTLGGSLAHNDPAACWPAGVLAANATIVTSRRRLSADDFFQAIFTTSLQPGELILGVQFPQLQALRYTKFEQPASRFALVGVAVSKQASFVRVAITGLGSGVVRWLAAELALGSHWSAQALAPLSSATPPEVNALSAALGDLHASADYRRHLAWVLTRQCVATLTGEALPLYPPLGPRKPSPADVAANTIPSTIAPKDGFGGSTTLDATPQQVWQSLLDPAVLRQCLPGCEALVLTGDHSYEATVKVGLGPLSVRFASTVSLRDLQPPEALCMVFFGQAGSLGTGLGTAQLRLQSLPSVGEHHDTPGTLLQWSVQVQMTGRLAQFGNRLVQASAQKLSAEFFGKLRLALATGHAVSSSATNARSPLARLSAIVRRAMARLRAFLRT